MSGLVRTGVEIPVVLGQEINIVEDKTVPVREFHSLAVANIEEHRSVEHFLVVLRYHEYSIMMLIKQTIMSRTFTYIIYSASSILDEYV